MTDQDGERPTMRFVITCLMGLLLPAIAAAAMPDDLQQKCRRW